MNIEQHGTITNLRNRVETITEEMKSMTNVACIAMVSTPDSSSHKLLQHVLQTESSVEDLQALCKDALYNKVHQYFTDINSCITSMVESQKEVFASIDSIKAEDLEIKDDVVLFYRKTLLEDMLLTFTEFKSLKDIICERLLKSENDTLSINNTLESLGYSIVNYELLKDEYISYGEDNIQALQWTSSEELIEAGNTVKGIVNLIAIDFRNEFDDINIYSFISMMKDNDITDIKKLNAVFDLTADLCNKAAELPILYLNVLKQFKK
jgi:hypothetical protein